MDPFTESQFLLARRRFLSQGTLGLGVAALASLLQTDSAQAGETLPHFAPRAKRVIYLFQSGAPSQLDLFDYKPRLEQYRGQDLPESIRNGQRLTGMTSGQKSFPLVGSFYNFKQRGQSGAVISDALPHI